MKYILGPEIIWILLLGISILIARSNTAPDFPMDDFIDKSWFLIALCGLMTYSLYFFPFVHKNFLFLRIWVICIFAGHHILETLTSAYSQQGPGIGMGYLAGMLFMIIALMAGSIMVAVISKF